MADELQTKRIIDLAKKTGPEAGDNLAVDNATSGTRRILWENLLDGNLADANKAAPAGVTGQAIEDAKTTFTDTGDGNIAVNYDEDVPAGTETPLKSIRFPLLPYKYTVPVIDPTLTQSGQAADAKVVGDTFETGRISKNIDIVWTSGYVNLNGVINNSYYSGFALIQMTEGETVNLGTSGQNITTIGVTNASSVAIGDTITPIYKKTSSDGVWEDFTFTASHDTNVVLCVKLNDYSVDFIDDIGLVKTIKHNYVTKNSVDIIDIAESENLFNPNTINVGYAIDNSGAQAAASYYAVSDYIPVSVGDVIRATPFSDNPDMTFALYDSAKQWVTGTRWTQTAHDGYLEITIPSGIEYITINLRGAYSNNVVVVKNTAYEAEYSGTYGKTVGIKNGLYRGVLYGKKIAYNGDSICESRIVSGTANNGGAYAHIISEVTGAKYENRAISGGILASAPGDGGSVPSRCVVTDVVNMTADADLVCFEGGINDYWRGVPLGDYNESDYSGELDTTTVCGALESIFRQAKIKWNGKPIVFVIVHKIKSTVYLPSTAGYTFAQEREKMIGICEKYSIPYYDAFAKSGLNAYVDIQNQTFLTSNASGTPDGCHPNEAAYKKYYVPQLISLFESVMPRN
jgi:lysophospholipase L1-like esterase